MQNYLFSTLLPDIYRVNRGKKKNRAHLKMIAPIILQANATDPFVFNPKVQAKGIPVVELESILLVALVRTAKQNEGVGKPRNCDEPSDDCRFVVKQTIRN